MAEIQSQEWLEEREELMQREDPRLTKLLQRLEKEDEYCYAYLPNYTLRSRDDENLLRRIKMEHSYKRMSFRVNNLNEDLKGEEVNILRFSWKPLISTFPEAKGIVDRVYDKSITVDFSNGLYCGLKDSDLIVYGRKGTWYRKERRYPQTSGDLFRLAKGDMVKVQLERKQLLYCTLVDVKAVITDREDSEFELEIPGVDSIRLYSDGSHACVYRDKKFNIEKLCKEYYK